MALYPWMDVKHTSIPPCKTERESWTCPNMKAVEGDTDMNYEHYSCKVCGKRVSLDYDEMR